MSLIVLVVVASGLAHRRRGQDSELVSGVKSNWRISSSVRTAPQSAQTVSGSADVGRLMLSCGQVIRYSLRVQAVQRLHHAVAERPRCAGQRRPVDCAAAK